LEVLVEHVDHAVAQGGQQKECANQGEGDSSILAIRRGEN
jgi:hypothetical protein